ncbi:MAG: glycosyltransferase family 39 protein [Anaerolineae bacterium]|nr:glycosyltransferase family 39 protein [Anaerolineae bacterium]
MVASFLHRLTRLPIDWGLIAATMLAVPLIIPFLSPGISTTADGEIHMLRIVSGIVNMQAGYFWPRWTPYLHQGFGYPLHNFHPPGMYVAGAIIYGITHLDPVTIFKLIQFIGTLLYPVGAYLFARTFTGKAGALVAAAAYVYAPFRFLETWSQGDIPQYLAFGLYPWLFWAIARGAERRRVHWVGIIGVCLGLIIVIHHASTFFLAPFAGLYTLLVSFVQRAEAKNPQPKFASPPRPSPLHGAGSRSRPIPPRYVVERGAGGEAKVLIRALATTIGGLAFGVMLSTVFWLPALAELSYIQIHTIQDAMFQIEANFLPLNRILASNIPVDRALLNWTYPYGPGGPGVGQPQVAAVVIGLLALLPMVKGSLRLKAHVIAGALVVALGLFLVTPESRAVWNAIPLAKLLQVPWRILGVVGLAAIPGAAAIPSLFPARWRTAVAGAMVGILFAAALPRLYAPLVLFQPEPPSPASTILYEQRSGNVALTSSNEYLPRWTIERPLMGGVPLSAYESYEWRVFIEQRSLPPGATSTALDHVPGTSRYQIQTPTAFTLTFRQIYMPGWRVTIDGTDAAITPNTPYGLSTVQVPEGTHDVVIWYYGTTLQHIANAISVIAIPIALLLLLSPLLRRQSQPKQVEVPDEALAAHGLALRVIGVFAVFIGINQTYIVPHTTLFRPHGDPSTPPAQYPIQQNFGDTIALVGYDLSTTTVKPGDTLWVQFYWRLLRQTDQALRVAVRLTSLDERVEWVKVLSVNPGNYNTRGWPLDTYTMDRYTFTIPRDMPPFVAHLKVAVFPFDMPYNPLQTSNGEKEYTLTDMRVTGDYKVIADSDITHREVTFGDTIKLLGSGQKVGDKGQSCLTFRWQQQNDPTGDYTVMIHWLDANGQMIGAADAPPLDGLYPTRLWRSGQTLDDVHCVSVPDEAKSVAVGLYRQVDGQRLPAVDGAGVRLKDDALIIPNPAR